MRKEEVYSLMLYSMRRVEYSREAQFNKLNKILMLRIYYNIFENRYNEFFKGSTYEEKDINKFIENFNLEKEEESSKDFLMIKETNEKEELKEGYWEFLDKPKKIEEKIINPINEGKEDINEMRKEGSEDHKEVIDKTMKLEEEIRVQKDKEKEIIYEINKEDGEDDKEITHNLKDIEEKIINQKDEAKETTNEMNKEDGEDNKEVIDKTNKLEEKVISQKDEVKELVNEINKEDSENHKEVTDKTKKLEEKVISQEDEVKETINEINKEEEEDYKEVIDKPKKIEEKIISEKDEAKEAIDKMKKENRKGNEEVIDKPKKIEEKIISERDEAKEAINEIKKHNQYDYIKKSINGKSYKIDEKYEEKKDECRVKHIINDIKVISIEHEIRGNREDKRAKGKKQQIQNSPIGNNIHAGEKVRVTEKLKEITINETLYGRVRFPKPILEIIDIKSTLIIKNMSLIKQFQENTEENALLLYDGFIRVRIEYLQPKIINHKDIDADSKYYLAYIPFEGCKKIKINDDDFKKETILKDRISFDLKCADFEIDTVLKEEKCINQYVNTYEECEVFIITEFLIYIFMEKIVEII